MIEVFTLSDEGDPVSVRLDAERAHCG